MRYWGIWSLIALALCACGRQEPLEEIVVRSAIHMDLTSGRIETPEINVASDRATTMTLDNSQFKIPTIKNALLDFGFIRVATLNDTSLRVCGPNQNQKCKKAMIRIYTTGTTGAGLFNSADNFGAPLTAALTTALPVGLLAANAAIMQTINIPTLKTTVRLTDFTPAPRYNIKSDFTNAGSGVYKTTLVVEYTVSL